MIPAGNLNSAAEFCLTSASPDESGVSGKVQARTPDGLRTYDDTPVMQQYGFASALPVGSVVFRFCVGGDTGKGVCVASAHKESRPRGLKPGQSMQYDQAGNGVLAGNDGVVTATAASGVSVAAAGLNVDGNIRFANGATGTLSSPTGQMAVVRSGLVHTITAPDGSGAPTNDDALQSLLAEIRACGDCAALNKLAQRIAAEQQALLADLVKQIAALNQWLEALTPPTDLQGLVTWAGKLIKAVIGPQYQAQATAIQQLTKYLEELAEIPAAIAEAAEKLTECAVSFPAAVAPAIPSLPTVPPGVLS